MERSFGIGRNRAQCLRRLMVPASVLAVRLIAWHILPIFDDAFITLRYARNLAAGHGFLYNPGEWVLGTTAPAFGLLATPLHLFGFPMPGSIVAANILCDVLIAWVVCRLLERGGAARAVPIFGALFALSPIMSRVCVGGMEVDLFLLLGLAAIVSYHRGYPARAAAIAAGACFLRPESALLVALFCALEILARGYRRAAVMALLAVCVVLPGVLLLTALYGSPVPQSVAAKAALPPAAIPAVLRSLVAADPLMLLLLPFALLGGLHAWRMGGAARTVVLWGAAQIAMYTAARPNPWPWYGEVAHGVMLVAASLGLHQALARFAPRIPRLFERLPAAATLAVLPIVVWGCVAFARAGDPVSAGVYTPLRAWCATHLHAGSTVAAYDVGALGYFCDAHVYDLAGLVWPPAVQQRWRYARLVAGCRPDYLYVAAMKETAGWLADPLLRGRYRLIARFVPGVAAPAACLDSVSFSQAWVQEYLLLQRVGP